jgi:hypothetical protein
MNADQRIFYSRFNGTSWVAQTLIPGIGTSAGPALSVFNNQLYMTWKGITGDDRVFYSHFNGTTWAAQQIVPGIGTNPVDIHVAEAVPGLASLPGSAAAAT